MIDLLVTAGTVITVDENRRVLFDGAVAIDRGRVVAVGPAHEVTTEYLATRRVDVPAGLAMPGLIDASWLRRSWVDPHDGG